MPEPICHLHEQIHTCAHIWRKYAHCCGRQQFLYMNANNWNQKNLLQCQEWLRAAKTISESSNTSAFATHAHRPLLALRIRRNHLSWRAGYFQSWQTFRSSAAILYNCYESIATCMQADNQRSATEPYQHDANSAPQMSSPCKFSTKPCGLCSSTSNYITAPQIKSLN